MYKSERTAHSRARFSRFDALQNRDRKGDGAPHAVPYESRGDRPTQLGAHSREEIRAGHGEDHVRRPRGQRRR
jgi:hypothetical protein